MDLRSLFVVFMATMSEWINDNKDESASSRPYLILVEGNVGSGKSTTLDFFSKEYGDKIDVVLEPVAEWQNVSNVDLLQKVFDDPGRWSGVFQIYSSLTRY